MFNEMSLKAIQFISNGKQLSHLYCSNSITEKLVKRDTYLHVKRRNRNEAITINKNFVDLLKATYTIE